MDMYLAERVLVQVNGGLWKKLQSRLLYSGGIGMCLTLFDSPRIAATLCNVQLKVPLRFH